MLFRVNEILEDIEYHVREGKPFSLVRPGDGDLRHLEGWVKKKYEGEEYPNRLTTRMNVHGFRAADADTVYQRMVDAMNKANYCSCFETILTPRVFWRNLKMSTGTSEDTVEAIKNYQEIYRKAGIENHNYCCPDVNWKLFLRGRRNLKIILNETGSRCMIVSPYACEAAELLQKNGVRVTHPLVVPNRYGKIFTKDEQIRNCIMSVGEGFDVMLMSASIVGRHYLELARCMGKVAIDTGKVMEAWVQPPINQYGAPMYWMNHKYSRWVHPRPGACDFELTPEGKAVYERYI